MLNFPVYYFAWSLQLLSEDGRAEIVHFMGEGLIVDAEGSCPQSLSSWAGSGQGTSLLSDRILFPS